MKQYDNKELTCLLARSLRGLVDECNKKGIRREDILQILPNSEGFFLLYYK